MKSIITTIIMTGFLLTLSTTINAQKENDDFKNFKITIEKSGNEIIMKCSEGCLWENLTYENKEEYQAINEFGMIEIKQDQSNTDKNLSNFLFTITKTDNGISLIGLKGTTWSDLSFSLRNSEQQMFNQFGMTDGK